MMPALLSVDGVSVAFDGVQALEDVTLEVRSEAIVGLIGPNGAGKTTLFNVISGLQRSDAGTVSLDGEDVTDLPADRRASHGMGRSFQNLGLMPEETVGTNIMSAGYLATGYSPWDLLLRPWRWRADEERLRSSALSAADALGLSEHWEERVGDLSFAAARFVELAALLALGPRLMLLDEPTTGLDLGEVDRLRQVLLEQREGGTTILLVAHDVRFVMGICDHVYVLAEGKALFDGSPASVQRHPAVVQAYLGRFG